MADLKKSYRQDDETGPEGQNRRLAELLRLDWNKKKIHRIERMERVNPASVLKGWRIHYES